MRAKVFFSFFFFGKYCPSLLGGHAGDNLCCNRLDAYKVELNSGYLSTAKIVSSRAVVLNWWVGTQKWVPEPFSVGRGSLPGEGNAKKIPKKLRS